MRTYPIQAGRMATAPILLVALLASVSTPPGNLRGEDGNHSVRPMSPDWKGDAHCNSIAMKLRRIPAGRFRMGGEQAFAQPIHAVQIGEFWMGAYEVHYAEFRQYDPAFVKQQIQEGKRTMKRAMQWYPKFKDPEYRKTLLKRAFADRMPVVGITWCQAIGFCRWLSEKEGIEYRLPTEAEWEYAARGGLVGKDYPWGDDDPLGRACIFSDSFQLRDPQDKFSGYVGAKPVGSYQPNAFGLFDMVGNVGEYCWDVWDTDYYKHSPTKDPRGPDQHQTNEWRVVRGGSFRSFPEDDLIALRGKSFAASWPGDNDGFRVVVSIKPWGLYSGKQESSKCAHGQRLRYPCLHPNNPDGQPTEAGAID